MRKIAFISSLIAGLYIMTGCGVQMLPMALDTAEDNDPYYKINGTKNSDYVELFTASSIFLDDLPGCWGFEKDACRDFMVESKIVYKGMGSLHLKWDKSKKGCDWIGVGFMWNNWQTVDMSDIIDTWALEFWVRTADGDEIGSVPINFAFLDSNNKSTSTIACGSKFYEGFGVNPTWKRVQIPLSYFRFVDSGVNPVEINQLIMSFEGTAEIYLDEMKLVELQPKEE